MKEILKYTPSNRILNKNYFVTKAIETKIKNDRTINMISKEVTDLIIKLFSKDDNDIKAKEE